MMSYNMAPLRAVLQFDHSKPKKCVSCPPRRASRPIKLDSGFRRNDIYFEIVTLPNREGNIGILPATSLSFQKKRLISRVHAKGYEGSLITFQRVIVGHRALPIVKRSASPG